mmetsp:Transcript_10140/g.22882  ORF Transcript_10140/g.22882 Transcript_10140/m.22882 type:complete len:209 (-) Transcript_10140:208-834(-)
MSFSGSARLSHCTYMRSASRVTCSTFPVRLSALTRAADSTYTIRAARDGILHPISPILTSAAAITTGTQVPGPLHSSRSGGCLDSREKHHHMALSVDAIEEKYDCPTSLARGIATILNSSGWLFRSCSNANARFGASTSVNACTYVLSTYFGFVERGSGSVSARTSGMSSAVCPPAPSTTMSAYGRCRSPIVLVTGGQLRAVRDTKYA